MPKTIKKGLDFLAKVAELIVAIIFAAMLVIMVYMVIARYVFHSAPAWPEELVRFLFLYLVFFGSAIAVHRGRHLQIDFISSKYQPTVRCIMNIIGHMLAIAVLVYICIITVGLIKTVTTISGGLHLPLKYVYLAIPIGSILMIVFSLEAIWEEALQLKTIKGGGEA